MIAMIVIAILISIEAIVIKVDDRALCYLSGLALVIFGLTYWQTTAYISVLTVVAGIYDIARGKWAY